MKTLLKAENLIKTYGEGKSKTTALDNVSLNVAKGEFLAIIGASGSGKSTLMNILGCLDKPTSGKYFFEDRLVLGLSADSLAKIRNQKIGFIFQSFNLLARTTALKNVELPLLYGNVSGKDMRTKAESLLAKVGLASKLNSRPSQLSGGEQQRVAIARALVNDPSVIFADEPTGNLDSKTSFEIMKLFTRLNSEGRTVVMITHEMDVARFASRIIRIHDGKIIEDKKNKSVRSFNEKRKS
ncbi:macrolide ABC transporter ATP-binding protein [Candidatus Curtissbacteria bacterium RIFCSPLOWO2_01_FULL_42_26]|uniref:Macrolide ABC transporter ATP-binding protein n=1 Tax=Candidatus Curtissbacteria bacterium RIFCSPLOWO2_01_FULL_42_26 TaxID=1797729 RepID=A0A1F5I0G3_9BACT|nr:MAG: macrolide ABC transporter ATP-binding protein [Candidatus Curtissbacteria bacterium RIFCSPLOWO2_01_FULL_42_26]